MKLDKTHHREIDLTATVTTPENVRFDFKIAGYARRFPAFVVDFVFRMIILWITVMFFGFVTGMTGLGFSTAFAIWTVTYFILSWGYGVILEYTWNGQTIGKRMLGIRVVMTDGQRIGLVPAMIRNLCRSADFLPVCMLKFTVDQDVGVPVPLMMAGIISMFITQRFQRLGDIAADTMVIIVERDNANRFRELSDENMERIAALLPIDLILQPSTVQALSLYIDRRLRLNQSQRNELSAILIDAMKLNYEMPPEIPNDLLICALHYREFFMRDDRFAWSGAEEVLGV
jgi:uncharacterized RDD family membrane protein YckC